MKLSDEQRQLVDGARRFMDDQCPLEFVRRMEASERGYGPTMWKQMAEMGWLGIDLPEELGGLGLGTLDLTLLMRELGRHLCPSPMLGSAVIAGDLLARQGSEAQRRELVPQIATGELVVAFAHQELSRFFHPGAIELDARRSPSGFVLNGTKMFVEFAGAADRLLVTARTAAETKPGSGLTLLLVDARAEGISAKRTPTMARDHHYELSFQDVEVPASAVVGAVDQGWEALEPSLHKGALAFSAFTNGASFELHERATEFAKQRVQFGRPIGQLQTIQGYLAQLIMEILGSDTLTLVTAFHMDRGRHVRGYVAKAKGFAAETVARTMDIGSQIFGGMGYMEEVDTTLYLRRGKQYQLMLGGTDYWYDVAAEEVIDVEEPVLFS